MAYRFRGTGAGHYAADASDCGGESQQPDGFVPEVRRMVPAANLWDSDSFGRGFLGLRLRSGRLAHTGADQRDRSADLLDERSVEDRRTAADEAWMDRR